MIRPSHFPVISPRPKDLTDDDAFYHVQQWALELYRIRERVLEELTELIEKAGDYTANTNSKGTSPDSLWCHGMRSANLGVDSIASGFNQVIEGLNIMMLTLKVEEKKRGK